MACHSASMEFPNLIDNFALAVVRLRFDRIAATTRPFYPTVTSVLEAVNRVEAFFGLNMDPDAMYQDSIPLAHAAWRTMVGALLHYIDKELKSDTTKFGRIRKPEIQLLSLARLIWEDASANVFVVYGKELVSLQDVRMLDLAETARVSFWYASETRLFFKTEQGILDPRLRMRFSAVKSRLLEGAFYPFYCGGKSLFQRCRR